LKTNARTDGRAPDQIRPISFELGIAPNAAGSVLVAMGNTRVICGVMIEETVPRWMKEQNITGGWLTAEYSMLPYSTNTRKPRDIAKGRLDGRSSEIQRLIGRSLRAVVDLEKLGSRTMWVDCDVLQADGGTRTAAITGAYVAFALANRRLLETGKISRSTVMNQVAAVSVGVVDNTALLDLKYDEDSRAEVDMNIVCTGDGRFIEVQGTAEREPFSRSQMDDLLELANRGIATLIGLQKAVIDSSK